MKITPKLLGMVLAAAAAGTASAADHRDGPLTTGDPAADINDVYTFVNPTNPAETIIATTIFPAAGLNSRFSDAVEYRTHIDRIGAAGPIVITCRTANASTTISCTGPGGLAASGNINQVITGTGMRLFAGLRDDPFFFDLDAFNRTRAAPPAPRFTNPGVNFFAGLNTLSIVFGIESARLTNNGANPQLKIYGSTNRVGDIGASAGVSGSWFDATKPGHGAHVEVLAPATPGGPDRIAVAWYVYNRSGEQRWIVGDGVLNGNSATITNAIYTSGGLFPPAFQTSQVTNRPFGTLRFDFTDCNNGTLTFTSTDGDFGSGSVPLNRLTSIKGLPCTFFSAGQIDRMGRPAINTALIDVLASTGKKDQYNRAVDPATWPGLFQTEMQNNLAALDTLDGVTGNTLLPPATAAAVLVDDWLRIDTSKPQCDAYLAVELGLNQCGGRTLARDVIDDSLGAIVGPGVSDNVGNDSTFLTVFPFLGVPN